MEQQAAEDGSEISDVLDALDRGENGAFERLAELLYPELKRLAHFHLLSERPGHTLNTTAIVHEAFIRMSSGRAILTDRSHFLRAASKVMRHLLVDYARRRRAEKRGGRAAPVTLDEQQEFGGDDSLAVLALDDAIRSMAELDPRLEQIVECRYFAGLSVADTAQALGMAVRTVEREWHRARGYLLQAMDVPSD